MRHPGAWRRGIAATVAAGVANRAADGQLAPLLQGWNAAVAGLALADELGGVVERIDTDGDDDRGALAPLVGGVARRWVRIGIGVVGGGGHALVVQGDDGEAVAVMLSPAVNVAQPARVQVRLGDHLALCDGIPGRAVIQLQAAVLGQLIDPEAQHVVEGIAVGPVAGIVVAVGEDDMAPAPRVDHQAAALDQPDLIPATGHGRVVLRLDRNAERLQRGNGVAVRDVEGEAGLEVLAAIVLEANPAILDVLLGEGAQQAERLAANEYRAVGGQAEQAIGELLGRNTRADRRKLARAQRVELPFGDVADAQRQGTAQGGDLGRRQFRTGAWLGGGAFVADLEGMHRQRRAGAAVRVDAPVARRREQAAVAVHDGELEGGVVAVARIADVLDLPGVDVGLGEGETGRQVLARMIHVPQVTAAAGHFRQRVGQALGGRLGVPHLEHAVGDRQDRARVARSRIRPEHDGGKRSRAVWLGAAIPVRIVVVGDDGQADGLLGRRRGRTRATAAIGHDDLEAVAGGFAAVVVVGEQSQVGVVDRLAQCHGRAVVPQRAMAGQAGDLHGMGGIVRIGDAQVAARTTDDGHRAAHQPHTGFPLDQHDAATGAGGIVHGRDVHGDGLVGQQPARAIVHGDGEGIGGVAQDLAAVVLVDQVGDVADGEGGADGQLVAVEQQDALAGQAGQLDDDLGLGVVHIDQPQVDLADRAARGAVAGGGGERAAAAFDDA